MFSLFKGKEKERLSDTKTTPLNKMPINDIGVQNVLGPKAIEMSSNISSNPTIGQSVTQNPVLNPKDGLSASVAPVTEKFSLSPPKNLPDLARDLYEHETPETVTDKISGSMAATHTSKPEKFNVINDSIAALNSGKKITEPPSAAVPEFDMSLIKNNAKLSESANKSKGMLNHSEPAYPNVPLEDYNNLRTLYNNALIAQYRSPSINQANQGIVSGQLPNLLFADEIIRLIASNDLARAKLLLSNDIPEIMDAYRSGIPNAIERRINDLRNLEIARRVLSDKASAFISMKDMLDSDIRLNGVEIRAFIETHDNGVLNPLPLAPIPVSVPESEAAISNQRIMNNPLASNPDSALFSTEVTLPGTTANVFGKIPMDFMQILKPNPHSIALSRIVDDRSKFFYASDGKMISSVKGLIDALSMMSEDAFRSHVNSSKNDFANWIRDVLNDGLLADKISKIYDKRELIVFLNSLIK